MRFEWPREQWNSPVSDYNMVSVEACRLIFDQAKIYFEETIVESEELTQRSIRILLLFLPSIITVIGFCISNQEKLKSLRQLDIFLLILSAGCAINCLSNLFKLINPKKGHYRGGKPEEIMRPEIFGTGDTENIEKALYISEIERCQIKIEQMEECNLRRVVFYTRLIYSFNIMLLIGILLLLRAI